MCYGERLAQDSAPGIPWILINYLIGLLNISRSRISVSSAYYVGNPFDEGAIMISRSDDATQPTPRSNTTIYPTTS
jgi:hypothetical protein